LAKSLLELKTDLKSLKYQGVNGSQNPYVTKDINNPPSNSRVEQEFFRRVDDSVRIAKAILPTNSRFLENQAKLLQAANSQKLNPVRRNPGESFIQRVANTALDVTRIAASTLAQIPLAGTGTRLGIGFQRVNGSAALQGSTIPAPDTTTKQKIPVKDSFGTITKTTDVREGDVQTSEIRDDSFSVTSPYFTLGSEIGDRIASVQSGARIERTDRDRLSVNKNKIAKFEDLTIPNLPSKSYNEGSQYLQYNIVGNSVTNLANQVSGTSVLTELTDEQRDSIAEFKFKSSNTGRVETNQHYPGKQYLTYSNAPKSISYLANIARSRSKLPELSADQKDEVSKLKQEGNSGLVPKDNSSRFEKPELGAELSSLTGAVVSEGPFKIVNYKTGKSLSQVSKDVRLKMGTPGLPKKPVDTKVSRDLSIDKLNAEYPFKVDPDTVRTEPDEASDLIKFNFRVVTPEEDVYLFFRAYLSGFSDDFQGNWSETSYIGRGEKMQTYDGFSRNISLSFKIAASTRAEMKPLYQKIVYLASTTAPTYGGGSFMRGTLVNLTVGDYLYNVPGVITSVNYKWETDYPWEIALEDDVEQLPHILDCSVSFRPIHSFIPQTGLQPYITNPTGNYLLKI
jgi:hypothetical protein